MKSLLIGFAVGLTLAVPIVARSETYYVDSRRGDDQAAGTSLDHPWRSLDKVNQLTLKPGDNVLFAAGSSFDGSLAPRGEGAPGNPITIGMYGSGLMPRIDGHGKVPACVHLRNTQYFTVQDLHLTNYGAERGPLRNGVLIDLENYGTAHEIVVRRLKIDSVNSSLIKNESGGAILFRNSGSTVKSRFNGLLIEENFISRTERNGIIGGSDYCGRTDWYPSLNVVIRRNLLEEIPGDGIVPIGCDGALVEGNVIRNGTPLLRPEHSAAAGIWPWSSDNTLIQYNEVSRHRTQQDGQGFDADWNCRGTIIQYNYSHHNDGGFLLICNDGGSGAEWNAGNVGTIIRYNVSFNDGLREVSESTAPGHRAATINVNGPCKDVTIHGNLIIVPRKSSAKVDNELVIATSWRGYPDGVRIFDNWFYAEGDAGFDTAKGEGFVFDGNHYVGPIARPADRRELPDVDLLPTRFAFPGDGVSSALKLLELLPSQR